MSKIKFDLETAKWIADKAQNDISVFPVELIECDKCGAVFSPSLGHDCTNVIDIDFHDAEEVGVSSPTVRKYQKEVMDCEE